MMFNSKLHNAEKIKKYVFPSILVILLSVFLCHTAFAYDTVKTKIPVRTNEDMVLLIETWDQEPTTVYEVQKQGNLTFEFDEPGDYNYTVRQLIVQDNEYGQYDTTCYNILVSMRDINGELVPIVIISNMDNGEKPDSLSFVNTYREPPVPEQDIPEPHYTPDHPEYENENHTPRYNDVATWVIDTNVPYYTTQLVDVRKIAESFTRELLERQRREGGDDSLLSFFPVQTGDTNSPVIYITSGVLAILAALMTVWFLMKNKKKNNHTVA